MKKIIILFFLLSLIGNHAFSQLSGKKLADSLLAVLPNAKEDSNKVNLLNSIGRAALNSADYEKSITYCKDALSISQKLNFKKGEANAYNILGIVYSKQGNIPESFKAYDIALKIRKDLGDQKGVAGTTSNISLLYQYLGNYPEALKYSLAALKINEAIDNKVWIAANKNNIGIMYMTQRNYPEALKYLSAARDISEEIGDKDGINHPYNNMGHIYLELGNYPEALKNLTAALKIRERMGDSFEIANSITSIGNTYEHQGKYDEAMKNYFTSLKIAQDIGNKLLLTSAYNNIGYLKFTLKRYAESRSYLDKTLALETELGDLEGIQTSHQQLAQLDSATGHYQSSLDHFKKYIIARDSLYNEENSKKLVQTQMQYDFDKKEAATKAEQEKKDLVAKKKLERQKLIRNGSFAGLAVVLLFAGVFFFQRNRIRKEKDRSDELLLNILPSETAEELKQTGAAKAKSFDEVTVMFTDFKNFTQAAEKLSAEELVKEINYCYTEFDKIMSKYNIEKIKTIGDSYMCAGGLPVANKTNATDVVNAGIEICDFMLNHAVSSPLAKPGSTFGIRIGIHTGPVVAGIVGIKKFAYDIWGDTVNIASRMESSGEAGQVNISGTTHALVKNQFTCTYRGRIDAKHKGEIDMYFVENNL
jgi:adenylate cyclase